MSPWTQTHYDGKEKGSPKHSSFPAPAPTRDELAKAAKTYQNLCICYRIRKRPSEKLFAQMEIARKTIARYEEETK